MSDSSEMTILSADEAASLLQIHKTTLYENAREGIIPCRRVGRRFIFVKETLIAWAMHSSSPAAV